MKTGKSKKLLYADITFIVCFIVYLFLAINNYFEFSHLEKYGIVQKAVVEDSSITVRNHVKTASSYSVRIKYYLYDEDERHVCSFSHKPVDCYYKGKIIFLLNDQEKKVVIPLEELGAAKRNKVKGYFIYAVFIVILAFIYHLINFLCDKNRTSNKWRKKQIKKNPELKVKYEKRQNFETTIIMIFILPLILLQILIESIFKKGKKKNHNK